MILSIHENDKKIDQKILKSVKLMVPVSVHKIINVSVQIYILTYGTSKCYGLRSVGRQSCAHVFHDSVHDGTCYSNYFQFRFCKIQLSFGTADFGRILAVPGVEEIHVQVLLAGDWDGVARGTFEHNPIMVLVFISFLYFSCFSLVNVIVRWWGSTDVACSNVLLQRRPDSVDLKEADFDC